MFIHNAMDAPGRYQGQLIHCHSCCSQYCSNSTAPPYSSSADVLSSPATSVPPTLWVLESLSWARATCPSGRP